MRFFLEEAVEYGIATTVAPGIRRVMANNPGPFTYHGTGTYIVGSGNVAVIDPGPSLTEHVDALVSELEGERVEHILITHTHLDHSPAAALLKNKIVQIWGNRSDQYSQIRSNTKKKNPTKKIEMYAIGG